MKKFSGITLLPAHTLLQKPFCTTPTTALGFVFFLTTALRLCLDIGQDPIHTLTLVWILSQHTEPGSRWTNSQRTILFAAYTFLGQPLCSCLQLRLSPFPNLWTWPLSWLSPTPRTSATAQMKKFSRGQDFLQPTSFLWQSLCSSTPTGSLWLFFLEP